MPRPNSILSCHLHRRSGQAVVALLDGFGGRRDITPGKFGAPAREASGRRPPPRRPAPADVTVSKVILALQARPGKAVAARFQLAGARPVTKLARLRGQAAAGH